MAKKNIFKGRGYTSSIQLKNLRHALYIAPLVLCLIFAFSLVIFTTTSESTDEHFYAATISSSTTYYKSGSSFYTLSSSVQHYRCTRSQHSGSNDYTTSSVSGTCYSTSGYYYDCTKCDATGSISSNSKCTKCSGSGSVDTTVSCGTCGGDGKVTCSTCNGRGYTEGGWLGDTQYGCYGCGGSGENGWLGDPYVKGSGTNTCSSCSGSGSKPATKACTTCGGDGNVTTSTSCTTCGGDGERYSSGSSYGHSISTYYVLYTYKNIDTGGTSTSQSAYSTVNKYSVKFNSNGGSGSMSSQYFLYGRSDNLTSNGFTAPTGKHFAGWATSSTGSVSYANGASVSNLTSTNNGTYNLYAVWAANTYKVAYNKNGGTGTMSNSTHTYGTSSSLTSNTYTRTGYEFQGWATSASGSVSYANGASVSTLTSTNGGTYTLYAVWKANTYYVAYNKNGGTGTMSNSTHTYGTSSSLTSNAYSRTGYTFQGWATSSTGSVSYANKASVSTLTSTKGGTYTLYAVWKGNTYQVAYNANGGTGTMSNSSHTYGTAKALTSNGFTAPTGKHFAGWATSASGSVSYANGASVSTLTSTNGGTYTLYAVWKANTYYVAYNKNGGTGTMSNSTHTYGIAKNLTSNGFTRTSYKFEGWATSAGGAVAYQNGASVTNLTSQNGATVTLYAVWKLSVFTVTYNANGGSGTMANSSHTYSTTSYLSENTFTRTGYTFSGWATSSSGTVAYSNEQNMSSQGEISGGVLNLYAKWQAHTYTVVYNSNGADSGSMSNSSHTYDTQKALNQNSFVKRKYAFLGWSTNANATTATYQDKQQVKNLTSSKNGVVNLYAIWQYVIAIYDAPAVSATYGGTASIIGDDFENLADADKIKVNAMISKTGYSFVGWYKIVNGSATLLSTNAYAEFEKSVVFECQLEARFADGDGAVSGGLLGGNINNSIVDIVVTSTKGGSAMIVGDDYSNANDQIVLSANLAQAGYTFAGWYLIGEEDTLLSSYMSVNVDKSTLNNRVIEARFVPIINGDTNFEVDNS